MVCATWLDCALYETGEQLKWPSSRFYSLGYHNINVIQKLSVNNSGISLFNLLVNVLMFQRSQILF